jgi:F0F1-type ATP synthase delta subunit
MKSTRVARRYAMAWLTEADALGVLDAVSKDVDLMDKLIRASRDFRVFLSSPVISAAKKSAVVKELLGNRVSGETTSFILLLLKKGRRICCRRSSNSLLRSGMSGSALSMSV